MNDQVTSGQRSEIMLASARTATVVLVAAGLFFLMRLIYSVGSAFAGFGGTVDHWPFIYVCVPTLFMVAFLTRRIGRWYGLIGSLLFTAYVSWFCWAAAAALARAYQTGWQDYGAQRWMLVHHWSLVWGITFAVIFFVLPSFRRNARLKLQEPPLAQTDCHGDHVDSSESSGAGK